eukprot:143048-Chlamydomonas_euryale.AAC.3
MENGAISIEEYHFGSTRWRAAPHTYEATVYTVPTHRDRMCHQGMMPGTSWYQAASGLQGTL